MLIDPYRGIIPFLVESTFRAMEKTEDITTGFYE